MHGNLNQGDAYLPTDMDYKQCITKYQKWLRGHEGGYTIDNYSLGQLEIMLVAELLGIRIGVFKTGSGTKLDSNGLMIPTQYFGPNTKESFNMFNDLDSTFYSLFPKLKVYNLIQTPQSTAVTAFWYKDRI